MLSWNKDEQFRELIGNLNNGVKTKYAEFIK